MEGNQITFFITYADQDREAVINLSVYDSVEQLKIEIDVKFDIPVQCQHISGWSKSPSTDDTILQQCCGSGVVCLTVSNSPGMETQSSVDDPMEEVFDLEIDAIMKLKQHLPPHITVRELTLQNAVSVINDTTTKKQVLLLYLHNSEDEFSQRFLAYTYDETIESILNENCIIIGWEIGDTAHHSALIRAVQPYPELSFVQDWIPRRLGGLICLLPADSGVTLFFCLNKHKSCEFNTFKEYLRNTQTECGESEMSEGASGHSNSGAKEIEAVESLRKKLQGNISVTFRPCTLDDALSAICSPQINERKALLLYLHNSNHPFSQMFVQNLKDGELPKILNRSFLILGWDVEDSECHDALECALSRHVNLAIVCDLVRNKVAVALCILPVNDTIKLFLCLRGKVTLKDCVKGIKNAEEVFKAELENERDLRKLEAETKSEADISAEKLQSIWADMLGDRDYDSFEHDEHEYLRKKIGFGIKGLPEKETGYDENTEKTISELYNVIKEQSDLYAHFKDHVEVAIIFNCLVPLPQEKLKRAKQHTDYNPNTDVNPVPLFILRKCRGSVNPCRIFIDDSGRVYQNWNEYLTRNKYPEGEMIVPIEGRYHVLDDEVLLERHLTPACQLDTKLLKIGDIASTVAGVASGGVFVTASVVSAAALPLMIAPPVLIGAGVTAAAAGVWTIGRSVYNLYDRNRHKESMSFLNSEARGAYLNIVAGSLGFVGAGANMALTQFVQNGVNIGKGATYTVNAIGVLNVGAGGASLANSSYDVLDRWINNKEAPSALTMLQLGTSILFFGHAVYNFRGAQTIIDETQAKVLQDYQDSLRSNRHRKTFNRLMKETVKTHGNEAQARAEVISALRNIPNKDEVFAALTRNTKALSKAGVRYSADGGSITLGGIPVDMNEFIGVKKHQTEVFLSSLGQENLAEQPNSSLNSNGISLKTSIGKMMKDLNFDVSQVNRNQIFSLVFELLTFCSGDVKSKVVDAVHQAVHYIVTTISKSFLEEIDQVIPKDRQLFEFLRIGISFFSQKVDDWEMQYRLYEQTRDVKYYDPLFDKVNPVYAKRAVEIFEFVVRASFSGQTLSSTVLTEITGYLTGWITRKLFEFSESRERERRRVVHSAAFRPRKVDCPVCNGYYYQHTITVKKKD